MCSADCFLALLAVLFPPLPVWVKRGLCSADSVINLALCMLGVVPGVLHAWYIIFKYPDPFDEYARVPSHGADAERGGPGVVTWYFVSTQPPPSPSTMAAGHHCAHQQPHQHLQQPHHEGAGASRQPPNYGTTGPVAPNSQEDNHGAGPSAGEGASGAPAVPPTYEQAIKGDHKVQAHD